MKQATIYLDHSSCAQVHTLIHFSFPFFSFYFHNTGDPSRESHCCLYRELHRGMRPSGKATKPSNGAAAGMVWSYPHYIKTQELSAPPIPITTCFPACPRAQMCNIIFAVGLMGGPGLSCAIRRSPRR